MKTDQDIATERNVEFLKRCWDAGEYTTEMGRFFYTDEALSEPPVFVHKGTTVKTIQFTGSKLMVCQTSNARRYCAWIHA